MSLKQNPKGLEISNLISHRKFLVYCTRNYWVLNPYLKGLHLTVDYWRLQHNKWVWKIKGRSLTRLVPMPLSDVFSMNL